MKTYEETVKSVACGEADDAASSGYICINAQIIGLVALIYDKPHNIVEADVREEMSIILLRRGYHNIAFDARTGGCGAG